MTPADATSWELTGLVTGKAVATARRFHMSESSAMVRLATNGLRGPVNTAGLLAARFPQRDLGTAAMSVLIRRNL